MAGIVRAAFSVYLPRVTRPPLPLSLDYAAAVAAGLVDVAIRGQDVAGMLLLKPEVDHLLLDVIAVDPACQGQGVGRQLLAHAEAEGRRRNLPEIRLLTNAAMTEAQAVYLRHGYAETHRATEDGRARVFYRKRLA